VGSNLLHYPGNCDTPAVDMITVKLHLISIISTKNARYCTNDLKDFYFNTPIDQPEYLCMKISDLPPDFVKAYNLNDLTTNNGTIYSKYRRACTVSCKRHPCTESPKKMAQPTWLPSKQRHTKPLET
jgi:hypothetical protein